MRCNIGHIIRMFVVEPTAADGHPYCPICKCHDVDLEVSSEMKTNANDVSELLQACRGWSNKHSLGPKCAVQLCQQLRMGLCATRCSCTVGSIWRRLHLCMHPQRQGSMKGAWQLQPWSHRTLSCRSFIASIVRTNAKVLAAIDPSLASERLVTAV